MTCVGDWMKMRCGDRVREIGERHIGVVLMIVNSAWVDVRWEDTGWLSTGEHALRLRDLERVRGDE